MDKRLKMEITAKNGSLTITLRPAKTFLHAEQNTEKIEAENCESPSPKRLNRNFV
jgi:hypothetical protein